MSVQFSSERSCALVFKGMVFSHLEIEIRTYLYAQVRGWPTTASLALACHPDEKLREQGVLGAMTAEKLQVGIAAGQKRCNEVVTFEAGGIHGGESDAVGIQSPILLARKMGSFLSAEFF